MSRNKFSEVDIAISITLHNEGPLLYKTFRSIARSIRELREVYPSLTINAYILMDNPDGITVEFVDKYQSLIGGQVDNINVYTKSFGDPSESRNFLIENALNDGAKYIQIFDGDDLFSRNYLLQSYKVATTANQPVVVMPELVLEMDEWTGLLYSRIYKYQSSSGLGSSMTNMYTTNLYQSQMLVDAEIFRKIKYTQNGSSYRYEDYHILLNILAQGYQILVAPLTMKLYRRKTHDSVLNIHDGSSNRCLAPTEFFAPEVFKKQSHLDCERLAMQSQTSWAIRDDKNCPPSCDNYMKLYSSHARNALLHTKYAVVEAVKSARSCFKRAMSTVVTIGEKHSSGNHNGNEVTKRNLQRLADQGFTSELLEDIKQLNKIDPLAIYNNRDFINFVAVSPIAIPSPVDDIYFNLCNISDIENITDLLLIPHITQGGADKAMIELCRTLSKNGRHVLAIATNAGDNNRWASKIREIPNVIFLERDVDFPANKINDKDLEIMLLRMVQNWPKLKTLTIMNSGVGYNLINDWHKEIRKFVKIYVHSWCFYINEYGMTGEPFITSLVYPYIDCLITDGEAYKKQLMDINGWDGEKILPIYLPINPVEQKTDYSVKRKIMYAGRFGSQKRIDLILQSREELAKNNIGIVFYGSVDQSDDLYDSTRDMDLIESSDNTEYAGPFNDFNKLPINDVDILILPTQYEGLPNIVLEALKANLFVIAGDAGSIGGVVKDYKNGFLVKENGSAEAYKQAILNFYNQQDKLLTPSERLKFNKKILRNHDQDIYEKNIMDVYGK